MNWNEMKWTEWMTEGMHAWKNERMNEWMNEMKWNEWKEWMKEWHAMKEGMNE